MDTGAPLRSGAPLLSRASSDAAATASSAAPFCLEQLPCLPCLPPESPLFHPKIVSSSSHRISCSRAATTRPPCRPRRRRRRGAGSSGSRCACPTSGARGSPRREPTHRSPPRPCARPRRRRRRIPFAGKDYSVDCVV